MSIVTLQIREGVHYRFRIVAVGERSSGTLRCPTLEFFDLAEVREPEDLLRVSAILDLLAERGSLLNEQKFKHVSGSQQIFEIRTPHGLRLFCFFDEGQMIVCTNGVIKKKQKADIADVKTAEQWRAAYFEAQLKGTLTHEPEHP